MRPPLRVIDLGTTSSRTAQAVYHAVAEAMDARTPDTLILVSPDAPHFCIGYHQRADAVLDLAYCRARGLPVLRRMLGGGAVYLDGDQLFYQCVFHNARVPARVDRLYARLLAPAIGALRTLGVAAHLQPVNEVVVGGRRLAGTGAARIGNASVVVGNILFDFAYEEMARAWRAPSAAFRELAAEGLRRYVTTLRRELPVAPAREAVKAALASSYAQALDRPLVAGDLSPVESAAMRRLERRLAAPSWVGRVGAGGQADGLKIAAGVVVREVAHRPPEGLIRATARLRDGAMEAVVLDGPGTGSPEARDALQAALIGLHPADRASVLAAIRRVAPGRNGTAGLAEAIAALASGGGEG